MLAGSVLQFDESRDYEFIAPDDGGGDVVLHIFEFTGNP